MEEFDQLLEIFAPISDAYFRRHTMMGKKRIVPRYEPHRSESFGSNTEKLFFLLVCLKTYSLQTLQGACFGISQGRVSNMIRVLTPLLEKTLKTMDLIPARTSEELKKLLAKHPSSTFYMDATERTIPRKVDYEAQKEDYSGKKKIIRLKTTSSLMMQVQ